MNSRERILKCIRREPIDRVPVSTYELVGWNLDAWENKEPSYKRLMDVIREKTDCLYMTGPRYVKKRMIPVESSSWTEGVSTYRRVIYHAPAGDLETLDRVDANVHTTWHIKEICETLDDLHNYLSIPYDLGSIDYSGVAATSAALGDKGVILISVCDPMCVVAELFDLATFLVYGITETAEIKHALDVVHERLMAELKMICANDVKDVIFRICGPEYATPPYLPPSLYHDFVTVYLTDMCKVIKEAGGIPRIHCHGKIGKVIDQFATTGAEGLDPTEPPPDGDISLAEIKRLYGDKFTIFGNIELKELEHADRDRIDMLVRDAMRDAKEGGGFILMPTAAPINIPLSPKTEENYLQFIESGLKYGKY